MATTIIDDSNIKEYVDLYIEGNKNDLPEDLRTIPIGKWDVSRVTDMYKLFMDAENFNEPLNDWDVSNVEDMNGMFSYAENFNQPLHKWNVSKVKNMASMFNRAEKFNQPLNDWDISNVKKMDSMFKHAENFNQPLNNWDVSKVENMSYMFSNALSFKQDLSSWFISRGTYILLMLDLEFYEENEAKRPIVEEDIEEQRRLEEEIEEGRRLRERIEEQQGKMREQQRKQQREIQERAIERAKKAAESAPLDNSPYETCILCENHLDNNQGPGSTENCTENCNDVVIVCENNHMFHRGCILEACNAGNVDIAAQMGYSQYRTESEQQRKDKCPVCQKPLRVPCNDFNDITKVHRIPDEELPLIIKGGKRRSTRRKLSKRKSNKLAKKYKRTAKSKRKNITKRK